jgi:4-hydroxy-tetrahydrodipicolinate reductase
MKIALIGFGKMGKAIASIAEQRGHSIPLIIDLHNRSDLKSTQLKDMDAAIEFTTPESARENVLHCMEAGLPTVVGTTGWLQDLPIVETACKKHGAALLVSSNFSIGVNIFFEINKHLAKLMAQRNEYNVSIEEIHHTQKKDAPSGTAISLAEQVLQEISRKKEWVNRPQEKEDELSILSQRIDPAPGTHTVLYSSAIDDIEIRHTAHNRLGFATGAVLAAEFIAGKKGLFTMQDVLGL